jgi:hypothetical protein
MHCDVLHFSLFPFLKSSKSEDKYTYTRACGYTPFSLDLAWQLILVDQMLERISIFFAKYHHGF